MEHEELTSKIIGAAIEVHRILGPGLLESAYEACLVEELEIMGLKVERQKSLPVIYKGKKLDCMYRLDIVVEGKVVVEVKSITCFEKVHKAQILSYLKHSGYRVGLLINFNVAMLKDGICRVVL